MKQILITLCAIAALGVLVAGCGSRTTSATDDAHSLTLNLAGDGRVISEPAGIDCPGACVAAFAPGTTVSLIAIPGTDAIHAGFEGACSGSDCELVMDRDYTVRTEFIVQEKRTVTVDRVGPRNGTVVSTPAGIDCPGSCTAEFEVGTTVELTAFPTGTLSKFGGYYGDCTGETCAIAIDSERTDGYRVAAAFSSNLRAWWGGNFGLAQSEDPRGIVQSSAGDTYIATQVTVQTDLGGGPLDIAGSTDVVIAKYDIDGVHEWSFVVGNTGQDQVNALALDSQENLIVVGKFSGTVDFGGDSLTSQGASDAFVAAYDTDGNLLWARRVGKTAGYEDIYDVAVDSQDNLFLAGRFSESIILANAHMSAGGGDGFIAKMNAAGNFVWSRKLGSTGVTERASAVSVGPDDEVVVAGTYQGTVNFGGGNHTSVGSTDVYVSKYSNSGTHEWTQTFESTALDSTNDVAVGPDGEVMLACGSNGDFQVGTTLYSNAGSRDAYLIRLQGNNGDVVRTETVAGSGSDSVSSVAIDELGNTAFAGQFASQVSVLGQLRSPVGSSDTYVAVVTSTGMSRGVMFLGSDLQDGNAKVSVDPNGHLGFLAFTSDSTTFQDVDLGNNGGWDLVLLRLGRSQ